MEVIVPGKLTHLDNLRIMFWMGSIGASRWDYSYLWETPKLDPATKREHFHRLGSGIWHATGWMVMGFSSLLFTFHNLHVKLTHVALYSS
jgi:hypothetical protein